MENASSLPSTDGYSSTDSDQSRFENAFKLQPELGKLDQLTHPTWLAQNHNMAKHAQMFCIVYDKNSDPEFYHSFD